MTKQNWEKIYVTGEQLNYYPYDFIVSNYFSLFGTSGDNPPKVLDLGCGGGNHSLFCAENGAHVVAVDYSESALSVTNQRAAKRSLNDKITSHMVDFDDFHIDSSGFDLVIDRLSVSHVSMTSAKQVYGKIYDLLNPNGVIFSNLFSTGQPHKDFGHYDNERDLWVGFTDGVFKDLLSASFYSKQDTLQLFERYQLSGVYCVQKRDLISDYWGSETWVIIARK